jgi:hypothetical protein
MKADTSGFKLHDILMLIGLEGRTGELNLESGNNIGSLVFHEGKILLAFSPYTRAIGDLLVEQGVLTDAELLDVLKRQMAGPHTPVGTLLVRTGKVTSHIIEKMVQEQIRKSVQDFSTWSPLDFNFVRKAITPFDSINLPVYEFIPPEIIKSSLVFIAGMATVPESSTVVPSPVSRP